MSTVGQLGERIASLAKKVEEQKLNDASSADRQTTLELAEASRELEQLVLGPRQTLGLMAFSVQDAASLGVIVTFDIPKLVPSEGSMSFAEISSQCGLDEDRLTRILRFAMINLLFREQPAGHVRHTPLSAHLAQSPTFCDFLRTIAAVFNPATASLPAALSR
ncbi:S-adenosyl-L-methionine-dependent methyltransferase [Apiospora phragmitis]|uniref:S-adenosyl-L-methionine-dependent methyltransferase n=1 Tax=Apiospora phragmitis TaxID=2905665 RepID=A0ABR1UZS2_9PEZI